MAKTKKSKTTNKSVKAAKTRALRKTGGTPAKKSGVSRRPVPAPRIGPGAVVVVPPRRASRSRKGSYTKQELEHFRKIIMEKKKEILEELETLRDSMMDVTTGEYASESSMYSTHMEQGTDAMEREKTFLFASREGRFLNYLEDALVRIDKGVYGKCTVCGKLIEKERLEAVPHAQQCLQCKLNASK